MREPTILEGRGAAAALAASASSPEKQEKQVKQVGYEAPASPPAGSFEEYDVFLSHIQKNAQDAVLCLQQFMKQERPQIKCFIDLDVNMKGDLSGTLREGVRRSKTFIFFITDGVLSSPWCRQELTWAVAFERNIVLVRETDSRHGGIDMKDFFGQVPDDLLHVFTENIAIPWYREPAFRKVSVESILKACELEDTLAADRLKLERARDGLRSIRSRTTSRLNCVEVIEEHSFAMKVVFFLGGFHTFRNPTLDRAYSYGFAISFWLCGALCATNLYYRCMPFHVLATDFLTAYVHLPAWQSWRCWRRCVQNNLYGELHNRVTEDAGQAATIARMCRYGGWAVLAVQSVMVLDVLMAFSLPGTLASVGFQGYDELVEWQHGDGPHSMATNYAMFHALAMWVIIPPVIAAMFASYFMFAFVALLHFSDIRRLHTELFEAVGIIRGFLTLNAKRIASSASTSPASARSALSVDRFRSQPSRLNKNMTGTASIEEEQHYAKMERDLCDLVVEIVRSLFDDVQRRIDKSSEAIGGLWLHLVFFSTLQILSIVAAIDMHASGQLTGSYRWWWGLQDFFHLAGGVTLVTLSMSNFSLVTSYLVSLARSVGDLLASAGCPTAMQSTIVSLIGCRPFGMHVLRGSVHIDASKALIFAFIILVVIVQGVIVAINHW